MGELEEINELIVKERLSRDLKTKLVSKVIKMCETVFEQKGEFVDVVNWDTKFIGVEYKSLKLLGAINSINWKFPEVKELSVHPGCLIQGQRKGVIGKLEAVRYKSG